MVALPDWLGARAVSHADRLALVAGDARWTWRELDRRVERGARALAAAGICPGDRVALLARNGAAFVVAAHALWRRGAALVPLNLRLAAPALAAQLADVGAVALLHDGAHAALAHAAAPALPRLALAADGPAPVDDAPPLAPRTHVDLDALAAVIYTSGTTGTAKGAELRFGQFWWSAVGSALNLGLHADDVWLVPLPLFHVGGLSTLLRAAIYGIALVVQEQFDPERANAAIDDEAVTLVSVVAVMLRRMFDARGTRPYPAALRTVLLGGGPAPEALLRDALARGVPVALSYGLTEACSQVCTLPPERALRKPGSSGRPLLPTELRIERDGVPLAAGEIGEIAVRGPTVIDAYVGRGPARGPDGWFRTGDLGYCDEDGDLWVLDRRDDLIVSGGENVYPAEVESVLGLHPDVAEAAVIGVDDATWGRVPVAVVRPRDGARLDPDALLAFAAARLARYQLPRAVRVRAAPLPRTAAGKLLRRALREEA